VLTRYRHCREGGTASAHAAKLARAVLQLRPERRREEAALMERTIATMLKDGADLGLFPGVDSSRDAPVFLLSIAYFFPTATMDLDEWPREEWLVMVVDWFLGVWRRGERPTPSPEPPRLEVPK
jgi:hypothetical protein